LRLLGGDQPPVLRRDPRHLGRRVPHDHLAEERVERRLRGERGALDVYRGDPQSVALYLEAEVLAHARLASAVVAEDHRLEPRITEACAFYLAEQKVASRAFTGPKNEFGVLFRLELKGRDRRAQKEPRR